MMSIIRIAASGIVVLSLVTITPDTETARTESHPVQLVAVASAWGPPPANSTTEVMDPVNFIALALLPLIPKQLAPVFFFFVYLPAFAVEVYVISAVNVVLNAFGLPLLPNVLDPPFGPTPEVPAAVASSAAITQGPHHTAGTKRVREATRISPAEKRSRANRPSPAPTRDGLRSRAVQPSPDNDRAGLGRTGRNVPGRAVHATAAR
ncbi:hypothetical protein MycrhDRAFT_0926 [Mycolicibacterium rhodesiae JS60]|nr:hypothetical protein MycrhDRAFT_0926 [Mycolicibacterium rhodesiae JS60]